MDKSIDLYHGSTEILQKPIYGLGRKNNDYGRGFYCTESEELAKEWACTSNSNGFANHYKLDTSTLAILNLNSEEYSILNWIAIPVSNRLLKLDTPMERRAKAYLEDNFMLNVKAYDVVCGYRADDAYYDFADAFLSNAISVNQLANAMRLGNLGTQVVVMSKRSFDCIEFSDSSFADKEIYYPLKLKRSNKASAEFAEITKEYSDGLYMLDIMREGVKSNDPRIPKNTP